jgi:hypothetical protein
MPQDAPKVKVTLRPEAATAGAKIRVEVDIGKARPHHRYRVLHWSPDEGIVRPPAPKPFPEGEDTLTFFWDTRDLSLGRHAIGVLVAADKQDPETGRRETVWRRAGCACLTITETAQVQALVKIEDCPEGAVVRRGAVICLTAEAKEPEEGVDYECNFETPIGLIAGERIGDFKWQAIVPTHRMPEGEAVVKAHITPVVEAAVPSAPLQTKDEQLEQMSVRELRDRARDLDIHGASNMNKSELIKAIRDEESATEPAQQA